MPNSQAESPNAADSADALVLAGLDAHRAGRLDDAAAHYARALRSDPRHADALNLSGALAFTQGRFDEAVRLIGKAVRANPEHLDAQLNLAEASEAAGRRPEAIAACAQVLAIAPDHAEAHARLALLHASDGATRAALGHARLALLLDPDSVEALCGRGLAFKHLRRFEEADAAYLRALELAPDDLRALTGRAALLRDTEFVEEPLRLYRRSVELRPNDPSLLGSLAALMEIGGDVAGALKVFGQALKLAPSSAELAFARGRCLRDVGRFDEARAVFESVAAAHPKYAPVLLALTRIKQLDDTPARRKQLTRIIGEAALPTRHRIQAGFALGEVLDRARDHDGAFARFAEANALYTKHNASTGLCFVPGELDAHVEQIDRELARDYATDTAGWGNASDLPVFVVGMPRSGTTLVEQICASHSQVAGLGELRGIQFIARAIATRNAGRSRVGEFDADFSRAEADRHLATLARLAGGAVRAVDKTPFNLMRLGLIGAMYPNARIIWIRRDPRDVVVSNHTMYFGQGNVYSTDLANCADATRQIERMGRSWQRETPLRMLEIGYEDLVADLEGHSRRIIDFLGLEWEPGVLDFHHTERHVDTPSSWQVRQPIYSSSVGRWRRFEKHLGPALEVLGLAG